jgi:hypothetical protein
MDESFLRVYRDMWDGLGMCKSNLGGFLAHFLFSTENFDQRPTRRRVLVVSQLFVDVLHADRRGPLSTLGSIHREDHQKSAIALG